MSTFDRPGDLEAWRIAYDRAKVAVARACGWTEEADCVGHTDDDLSPHNDVCDYCREVTNVAEAFMVSKFDLFIPTGESTQSTTCTMSADATLISVQPHMHMLGTHMKATAESTEMGDVVMIDDPYDFDDQTVKLLPQEIPMRAGDRIRLECTYNNTTGSTVFFGDSSLQEMCISGHFRYPALDDGVFCTGGF